MNYLQSLLQQLRIIIFGGLLVNNMLLLGIWYASTLQWSLPFSMVVAILFFAGLIFNVILAGIIGGVIMQPIKMLWRNILYMAPKKNSGDAIPKSASIWFGKDLVATLTGQVRELAMMANSMEQSRAHSLPDLHQNFIANALPLPLLVLDKNENILFANTAALKYFDREEPNIVNHNLRQEFPMTFPQGEQDMDKWLAEVKQGTATATRTWDAIKLHRGEDMDPLQYDLAAFYNRDNPMGAETMLVFFDHTGSYSERDQEVDFVALAVHELRTPITMLRGYIEALDEDLSGTISGESADFFKKMKASSEQLNTFINNMLDFARIEGNQLEIQLQEENWHTLVNSIVDNLRLRASVHNIELTCTIPEDLPTVGVDRFTITEVITNLVDNAIKYSIGKGTKITISGNLTQDGLVETSVQDNGVGIAESVIPTLFNKFQRSFHNRASIKGTGLGLYLSKFIVNLHGGNIWVSSKEGEGTTVGFTVHPYANLTEDQKTGQNSEIVHSSHGWIKNHSMSRR